MLATTMITLKQTQDLQNEENGYCLHRTYTHSQREVYIRQE